MGIYVAEQARVFLLSLLVGAGLGVLYDMFRISRVAFFTPPGVIVAEDILFFCVCGIVTFFFGLSTIDGVLRIFLIIGELIGWVLYFLTLGKLVMGVAKKIILIIRALLNFIIRWIVRPVWLIFYHIISLILRPIAFLWRILKKLSQNIKFRLKTRRKVLYNQLTGYITGKKSNVRKRKNEKTKKNKLKKLNTSSLRFRFRGFGRGYFSGHASGDSLAKAEARKANGSTGSPTHRQP